MHTQPFQSFPPLVLDRQQLKKGKIVCVPTYYLPFYCWCTHTHTHTHLTCTSIRWQPFLWQPKRAVLRLSRSFYRLVLTLRLKHTASRTKSAAPRFWWVTTTQNSNPTDCGKVAEGADWGNVQICALFALWIQPFTAHSANWHHPGFKC